LGGKVTYRSGRRRLLLPAEQERAGVCGSLPVVVQQDYVVHHINII
jgi:hypothetical protein